MSSDLNPVGATRGVDERIREHGLQLVTLISAVIRIGRAYSVTNQVFRTQLTNIASALRPLFEHSGEAVFVALGDDLYLNGVRIQVNASNFRFHRNVIDIFRSRSISGIRFERGLQVEDLAKFFVLFLDGAAPHGSGLLKACGEADLQRVLPVVHATTDPTMPGDGLGGGQAWNDGAPEPRVDDSASSSDPHAANRTTLRGAANRRFTQAFSGARALLMPTTLNAGLEMRHAKRVVQPLVDGAFSSEPVVVGLSGFRERDDYTYAHSVNVSAIAVTMGHFLSLDRRTLADIGVAALLHDVGKSAVAEKILHPLEAFTEEERVAAERHPIEGAKLLAGTTTLNATTLTCMRVALEHHWLPDGQGGFPRFRPGWRTSLISQIVGTADCYVNLHSRCGDLVERITPYQSLGMMLGPLRDRFEPALLWALVQSVGFYPPGQPIELEDDSVAIVLAPNKHDMGRPYVRLLVGPGGRPFGPGEPHELLPIPPELSVRRALVGTEAEQWETDQAA